MIGVLVRWLPLSLAIHAAAFATTLLLPRELALSPLFVDLTLDETVSEPSPPAGGRRGDGRPAAASPPARRSTSGAADGRAASAAPPESRPAPAPPAEAPSAAAPPMATPRATPAPSVVPPPAPMTPPVVSELPAPSSTPAPIVASPPPTLSAPTPGDSGGESPRPTAWGWNGVRGPGGGTVSKDPSAAGEAGASGSPLARGGGEVTGGGSGDATLALAIPGDGGGLYASYLALLRRRVQEAVTYPEAARRRSVVGTVHLEIGLEPSGRISEVSLVRSSSHAVLDEAAVAGVRALRRVPFPPDVQPRALRVRLPVVFELR